MGGYLADALLFVLGTALSLCLLLAALRFLLQTARADTHNPLSQFLLKTTNPPLRPLRRVIPRFAGVDWACVVLMISIKALELALAGLINHGAVMPLASLAVLSAAKVLALLIHILMIVVFTQVILSWLSPGSYNAITALLHQLSEPLLRPARRLLPPIHGIDLSPVIVFVALQLGLILLARPLADLAGVLAV